MMFLYCFYIVFIRIIALFLKLYNNTYKKAHSQKILLLKPCTLIYKFELTHPMKTT